MKKIVLSLILALSFGQNYGFIKQFNKTITDLIEDAQIEDAQNHPRQNVIPLRQQHLFTTQHNITPAPNLNVNVVRNEDPRTVEDRINEKEKCLAKSCHLEEQLKLATMIGTIVITSYIAYRFVTEPN